MADTGQEKTEQATGKKLEDSRQKGQVARSQEINSFAIFFSGFLLISFTQKLWGDNLSELSVGILGNLDKLKLEKGMIFEYAVQGFFFYMKNLGPFFAGMVIVALVAGYAQVGFKFSMKALAPKASKFNPLTGLKNIFASSRSLVEVFKSIVKLGIIGVFTYYMIYDLVMNALGLVDYTVSEIAGFMVSTAYDLIWKISVMYALIAGADFVYQKVKFKKDMMMTKQEVKEESRESEGNPEVKGKIRGLQVAAARKRMMKDIPTADVVITNPTHFAVAIKYKLGEESAPKVVAKGMDFLAQKIKQVATENGVPLHEDVALARALYKHCEVGDEIPENLYKAVAQILAFIYKLKNNKKKTIV